MPRPRSESFYLNLAPSVSAALSIHTKASLSRSPPSTPPPTPPPTVPTSPTRPFPKTLSIPTVALPEDADDERDVPPNLALTPLSLRKRSNPELKLAWQAQAPSTTRGRWSPKVPSPLRRDASKPFCPSSLFTSHTALLPLYPIAASTNPPLPLRLSTRGYTATSSSPSLSLHPRGSRTPLHVSTLKKAFFAGPSGSSARRFGVRTAWNIDEDVRRSLATTDQLHSIFEFSSSEDEHEEDDVPSPCRSSTIEHPVTGRPITTDVQAYPAVRPASHHKRSLSEQSDEDTSSGSDGGEGEGYSSSHFDDSSSDEEEGLHLENLENEETWEVISI